MPLREAVLGRTLIYVFRTPTFVFLALLLGATDVLSQPTTPLTACAGKDGAAFRQISSPGAPRILQPHHLFCTDDAQGLSLSMLQAHANFTKPVPGHLPAERARQTSLYVPEAELKWDHPEDSPSCPRLSKWLPPGITLVSMVFVFGGVWWVTNLTGPVTAACSIMLFLAFMSQLNYTVIIPDSYPLAKSIGNTASYSGQIIGIYKPGSCVGSFLTWMLVKTWPDIWRTHPKLLLCAGLHLSIVGAAFYTGLAVLVQSNDGGDLTQLAHLFLLARFLLGVGAGLVMQLTFVSMARLTAAPKRPDQMAQLQLSNTLGIAGGPFMDSVMRMLEFCPNGKLSFETDGIFQVLILLTGLSATICCYPNLRDAEDYMKSTTPLPSPKGSPAPTHRMPPQSSSSDSPQIPEAPAGTLLDEGLEDTTGQQRIVILGSITMTTARAISVAGVEAAAVMLLQREYAWEESTVGMSVGLTFLTSIPLKAIHSWMRENLSLVGWIRLLAFIGLLGSLMYFITASGTMLLVATMVVFPTMYLSDALSLGAMQQHCLPDGSWFDANHTMLWFNLTVNGAGHFFGPIVARYCVEQGGQHFFACQQLLLCLLFAGAFECIVRPHYIVPEKGKEPPAPSSRPRLGTM
mmetsp:Transcript_49663/g.115134  ORF Transcript_49663/g.115134 Transcript_49663/m.115134 type:complete len:631 (-) Transcript_49663:91-1983(-)